MIKDRQADKAYEWEDSFLLWAGAHLNEKQARGLIEAACREYGIPPPYVKVYKSNYGCSIYDPNMHVIKLRPRHLNAGVVLHETAHAITDTILGQGLEPHGPEWLGVYMVLLEDFRIMPRAALHASAKKEGLKYKERDIVDKKAIRRLAKKKAP